MQVPAVVYHSKSLQQICTTFKEYEFYNGILDLCLKCAQSIDPTDQGLTFFQQKSDQGQELFYQRKECYQNIFKLLEELIAKS